MKTLTMNRPVVFFDLETTGLDFKYDRIIEIGALKLLPDGTREHLNHRVNPGIRIPAEITALTGIRNEDVAEAPSFSDLAGALARFFDGADLGGYNVIRFDARMLQEEFHREGIDFGLERRRVIDAQSIFHQKERRDLSAAYKFYCDKDLVGAHSAEADVLATVEILLAQLNRYQDLPVDVEALSAVCRNERARFVDTEGKLFWRDGEAVFNFGKYKSRTLRSVCDTDPGYLDWIMSPDRRFAQDMIDICYKARSGTFPVRPPEAAPEGGG